MCTVAKCLPRSLPQKRSSLRCGSVPTAAPATQSMDSGGGQESGAIVKAVSSELCGSHLVFSFEVSILRLYSRVFIVK